MTTLFDKLGIDETDVGKLSSPMMSKTIEGKSALDKAVDELDKLAK